MNESRRRKLSLDRETLVRLLESSVEPSPVDMYGAGAQNCSLQPRCTKIELQQDYL